MYFKISTVDDVLFPISLSTAYGIPIVIITIHVS